MIPSLFVTIPLLLNTNDQMADNAELKFHDPHGFDRDNNGVGCES